uniref:Uncharacterized protein n=1 Tax=Cacopsylla melanoneura TaxID=428564 RepID=A0A8D8W540_9HEMI
MSKLLLCSWEPEGIHLNRVSSIIYRSIRQYTTCLFKDLKKRERCHGNNCVNHRMMGQPIQKPTTLGTRTNDLQPVSSTLRRSVSLFILSSVMYVLFHQVSKYKI